MQEPNKNISDDSKDTLMIPQGDYCYTFTGEKGIDEETGLPYMRTKRCPYQSIREFNGVTVDWCDYLDCGDVGNCRTDEEYEKLLEHFGSEEELTKSLPLFLLWDGVKECGINKCDDDMI